MQDKIPNSSSDPTHRRKTTSVHLQFETIVQNAVGFKPLPKNSIYRLIDKLQQSKKLSNATYFVLKAIVGAAGETLICNCSNATLADRSSLADCSQVSRAIRKLRDIGFITVYDSANCKRDGRFGLSIEILHIRHDALMQQAQTGLHELREKKNEQRAYRSDIRRIVSFIEEADLSEDMAHTLYEYKEMAKAIIADAKTTAKTTTAALYARARAVLSRALRDVLEAIAKPLNTPNMSCGHDKSANHLPITTLNPIRICSDERQSANADHFDGEVPASGDMALEKKPDVEIETCKDQIAQHREAKISIEMVMQACPEVKHWVSGPIRSWHDLVNHIDILAKCCGINVSAILEARTSMGGKQTALAVAIALQKSSLPDNHAMKVNNAGGYLRGMIKNYHEGKLKLSRSIFGLLQAAPT